MLGYCPEADTLFPKLSPYDHLVFFSLLRNNSIKEADALEMLTQIGLADKANVCSEVLSCGQKRKISIACAFVGNTKTVILDEPSTGLDPGSRQDMWRALKSWRQGRTIFMTTHFMVEAENLGDRIAIMEKGRIKCCGTPMFLKEKCGLEHMLTIVKGDNCKDHKVVQYVMSIIRKAIFQTSNNSEISFTLPGNRGTEIPKLLQGLEENKETLNITSYMVASTSVEDVFTRLDENTEAEIKSPTKTPPDSPHFMDTIKGADFSSSTDILPTNQPSPEHIEIAISQVHHITGHPLRVQQLYALMRKRWILFQRNLLPVLLFMLASIMLLVLCIIDSNQSQLSKSMYFKAQDYNDIIVVMGKPLQPEAQQIYNSVKELLPPDFHVIEPDPTSTYYDYLKDWGQANSVDKNRDNLMMGFEIKQPPESSIVYYQSSFVHSEAVAVNLLLNAHVRAYLGATHSIQSGVYPHDSYRQDFKTQLWMMRLIHLSLIGFQLFVISWHIYERSSGAQQLQSISGCHYCMFWFSNFLFDLAVLLVCSTLLWLHVCALHVLAFDYQHMLLLMFMQFMLFVGVLPLLYLFQYFFHKASTASFLFVILTTAYAILLSSSIQTYLVISPNVLFLEFYSTILGTAKLEGDSLGLLSGTYWLKSLTSSLFFWFMLLVVIEWDHTTGHKSSNIYEEGKKKETNKVTSEIALEGDDEVITEKNRILNSNIKDLFDTDELILVKVSMRFLNCMALHLAVDDVSFGVAKSECFGLLGENGAGRSTMFRLLVCDLSFCNGDIYYSGLNLYKNKIKIYQNIGYCPQQDGFHGDLTGRESLQLYGQLKGIPKENLKEVIDGLLKQVMLEAHADKLAKYYSSGDKRKLSIAIAMIGSPKFLLLDQPTSGVDIICKKAIWSVVQNLKKQGTTVVLSSDSMEECEALCTRLTIMAQGKLLCLGTPQHLKTKYAQGLTIIVHLKPQPGHAMDEVIKYLKELFDQIEIFNQLDTYLHLQVPAEMFPLSVLFDKMETAKKDLDLEHYTIQQASLEQVFLMLLNKTKTLNKTERAGSKLTDVQEQNDKHSTVL
ncbi:ATP-binding cassette sub-family A member 2-like isoform X2 [Physella acuta]|uniref:ATP-binding cassette sub-family A member 2-like isoform X2 n=1 Tax=Physella acuta TaxID=109671 RepID=UPI0027DCC122|nr:ATP-binding cassette sub-family A member 2-like isoform X2 [Physella acuta]